MSNLIARIEEYLENLHQIKERSDFQPPADSTPDEQIAYIRRESEALNALQTRNNDILYELFYSRAPENLTDAEAAEWFQFACQLVDGYKQADLGLAHQLHKRLLRRARAIGRWEDILEELYYCGLTLYYLNSMVNSADQNVYYDEIREYFEEGASFLPSFASLDSKSRAYILRCLGNIHLGYPSFVPETAKTVDPEIYRNQLECFDRAYAVMTDPELRAIDPGLAWDDYIYALHFCRTGLLSLIRVDGGTPEICEQVYESAHFVYQRQEQAAKGRRLALSARTIYVYAAACYHSGRISCEELLETLLNEAERPDEGDGTANRIYRHLSLVTYLRYYMQHCPQESRARFASRVRQAELHSHAYVREMPLTDYFSQAVFYMRNNVMVSLAADNTTATEKRSALMRWFLACHRPTYIHSLMVAWLTRTLLKRLIEQNPGILHEDVAGCWRGTEDVDALLVAAGEAALYHDVGKLCLLDIVSNYGRRLTDEEFALIQLHPVIGRWMLGGIQGMELCAEAALNHHRHYDELGGYPRHSDGRGASLCNLLTDIVTIADSLDAGTDNVGRSYAKGKTFPALIEELREGRDTRYAGYVVDLFDDGDFSAWLSEQLIKTRRRTYCAVYCGLTDKAPALELDSFNI